VNYLLQWLVLYRLLSHLYEWIRGRRLFIFTALYPRHQHQYFQASPRPLIIAPNLNHIPDTRQPTIYPLFESFPTVQTGRRYKWFFDSVHTKFSPSLITCMSASIFLAPQHLDLSTSFIYRFINYLCLTGILHIFKIIYGISPSAGTEMFAFCILSAWVW